MKRSLLLLVAAVGLFVSVGSAQAVTEVTSASLVPGNSFRVYCDPTNVRASLLISSSGTSSTGTTWIKYVCRYANDGPILRYTYYATLYQDDQAWINCKGTYSVSHQSISDKIVYCN